MTSRERAGLVLFFQKLSKWISCHRVLIHIFSSPGVAAQLTAWPIIHSNRWTIKLIAYSAKLVCDAISINQSIKMIIIATAWKITDTALYARFIKMWVYWWRKGRWPAGRDKFSGKSSTRERVNENAKLKGSLSFLRSSFISFFFYAALHKTDGV